MDAGESRAAVEHLLEARRLDPIRKNDPDKLTLALGQQLPPFRWIAPLVVRWWRWHPKAIWGAFMGLAVAYMAIWWAFPGRQGNGGWQAIGFGEVVVNLLVLPASFDVLATAAALWVKRRTIGAAWYEPLLHTPATLWVLAVHAGFSLLALFPLPTFLLLLLGSCTTFLNSWVARSTALTWHDLYGISLAFSACASLLLFFAPTPEHLVPFGIFAALSLVSDNLVRLFSEPQR